MWIKKEEKQNYNDSSIRGLRVYFYEGVTLEEKSVCTEFCNWLRKRYWFPIRIKLYFIPQKKFRSIDDGHFYYGIFYSNEEYKTKRYPCICVAARIKNERDKFELYFTVVHELTHYFQWYFFKDEKLSSRSLEIEANKWSKYLISEFLNDYADKED